MSLDGWQRALVARLTGDDEATSDLTADEARWIARTTTTAGFAITRRVQREWRAFRIGNALPLTSRLLAGSLADLMERYLGDIREPASFFLSEAEQFVAWCPREGDPHFDAVSRFELAMLRAAQVTRADAPEHPADDVSIRAMPGTDVIEFSVPPVLVLGSLAAGVRPPAPLATRHPLLCASRACREASPAEAAMVTRLQRASARAAELDRVVLRALWDAGALIAG
jgi:hypothetical protein